MIKVISQSFYEQSMDMEPSSWHYDNKKVITKRAPAKDEILKMGPKVTLEKQVVRMSRELALARQTMSIPEVRIIRMALMQISYYEHYKRIRVEITADRYAELFQKSKRTAWEQLALLEKTLRTSVATFMTYELGNYYETDINWFSSVRYFQGRLYLEFSNDMLEHVANFPAKSEIKKSTFVSYRVGEILKFNSASTIRLKEAIQAQGRSFNVGTACFTPRELKHIFGVEQDFSYLNQKVLKVGIAELAKHESVVSVKLKNHGRNIERVDFRFSFKQYKYEKTPPPSNKGPLNQGVQTTANTH